MYWADTTMRDRYNAQQVSIADSRVHGHDNPSTLPSPREIISTFPCPPEEAQQHHLTPRGAMEALPRGQICLLDDGIKVHIDLDSQLDIVWPISECHFVHRQVGCSACQILSDFLRHIKEAASLPLAIQVATILEK